MQKTIFLFLFFCFWGFSWMHWNKEKLKWFWGFGWTQWKRKKWDYFEVSDECSKIKKSRNNFEVLVGCIEIKKSRNDFKVWVECIEIKKNRYDNGKWFCHPHYESVRLFITDIIWSGFCGFFRWAVPVNINRYDPLIMLIIIIIVINLVILKHSLVKFYIPNATIYKGNVMWVLCMWILQMNSFGDLWNDRLIMAMINRILRYE